MRIAASVLLLALLPLSAAGQTIPFRDEIEVRVIDVDVVVTDRQGNPITDLKREDFELYEDGKRVEIAYFSRVVGGRIADVPAPAATAEAAATPAPRTPLTWVVFIDHTNITPARRNQTMRQLQQFLARAITAGDRGVVALNDGRSFRIRQGLTDDPKLLMEVLAKMEKERMSVSPTMNRSNQILNQVRRTEAEMGVPLGGAPQEEYMAQNGAGDISSVIEEEALRTKNAIRAMGALVETLARVEGRVALVYVGAGFNAVPGAHLVEAWRSRFPQFVQETFAPRPDLHREPIQREITRLFNDLSALRVTVYTIHAGDSGGAPTNVDDGGHTQADRATSSDLSELVEAGHAREMAQRTGGLFFKTNQQLADQLEAMRRDLSNYYSLGYKPTGTPGDARRIRVKVGVAGARVRHRETVRERTLQQQAAGAVVAAMVQPQPPAVQRVATRAVTLPPATVSEANPLGVRVEADKPRADGWSANSLLPFRFSIQLDALTFVKRGNGRRADFVMHFALVDRDGSVYPLEIREQSLAIPENELPASPDMQASYAWHVDLAALKIPADIPVRKEGSRLTVTVEDRASGTRSVVTVPIGRTDENRG